MTKDEAFLECRRLLFSVAYDMLGVIADAEDVVQEAYVKWMSAGGDAVQYPKAFLVKIVTNLSINLLRSSRKKREQYVGTWLPEPLAEEGPSTPETGAELYSSLSVGMMVLLERLTAQERAVFLLKEVFAYDYREIAEIMDKGEENCRQIFKRARDHLGEEKIRFQVDLRTHEKLVGEFLKACTEGNMDALIALLRDDITIQTDNGGRTLVLRGEKLSALPKPLSGSGRAAAFLMSVIGKVQRLAENPWRKELLVGGMPCLVTYSAGEPINLTVMEIDAGRIANIFSYGNPEKIRHILAYAEDGPSP